MESINLTPTQSQILQELVNLYRQTEQPIKGERIAERMDRNPGTIRNQMQSLKMLQLAEGVPGPKGGYMPTSLAYEVLEIQTVDQPAEVPLQHNGELLETANAGEINLTSVHHPSQCRAKIQIQGSIATFAEGDTVTVGPTPLSKLQIIGTVNGKDETSNTLVLTIDDMRTLTSET